MKTLLVSAFLLATASSYGAAVLPAGLDPAASDFGRLTDYNTWFREFKVASDVSEYTNPFPAAGTPAAFTDTNRQWSGWSKNWTPGLTEPIAGTGNYLFDVELVFLGETAGWWDDLGYRYNGVDYLLADGVQAKAGLTRTFGDYAYFTLSAGDTLDFFITGSGIKRQDGAITVNSSLGGKYYVFDKSLNTPAAATSQSYYGTITPLTSVRGSMFLGDEQGVIPFTVLGFEDTNLPSRKSDKDYNDFLFAFRAGGITPCCIPVPEASTYGVWAAMVLLGLVATRRRRTYRGISPRL